ncbi:MAG: VWA domain-containing protein [Pelagimonas sp.]|jgi:Ca-activated chloride channel family protein|nr:VWA domain-containing protein [Pelagimonas sp.]
MSDFDDLKRALDAATPAPDPDKRAQAIAQAAKNFAHLQKSSQGMADDARHTSEHPKRGLIFKGVQSMLNLLSNKAVLTATTAVAAVGLVMVTPALWTGDTPPMLPKPDQIVQQDPATDALETVPVIIVEEIAEPLMEPIPMPMIAMDQAAPGLMAKRAAPVAGMAAHDTPQILVEPNSEAFPEVEDNPIKVVADEPVSTFSVDVDTASWGVIRNSLNWGSLPPKDAVRIEEMVNYFPYDYPAPQGDTPFETSVGVMDSPWRAGTQIVHIGLQGAMPAERPPLNLVFLIDTSGSMEDPQKLPLLIQSFRLMLGQLDADDQVSIVTYAGSAGRVLDPTPASERDTIMAALENLHAGGGTAGQEGLQQAYATAAEMAREGAIGRVILATDGDFNIGIHDPEALEDYIADQRDSGTYLSVLGFGRGNLDDATMQALAQAGNGNASYIDTLSEAQKVLVDELTGALVPIADDVKIQVEFNPATVAEYRLIGYETRALNREDFNNDKVDAGEIGAGHQVTALYEITPVGSDARLTDPLRYGAAPQGGDAHELGFLRLRYKAPGADDSQLIETPILTDTATLPDANFALAIAGFGQILRGSDLIGSWNIGDAIDLAVQSRGKDAFGYRQEAVNLMRLAQSLQ